VLKPNKQGVAKSKVAFDPTTTSSVEVTLVNASSRFRSCYSNTTHYSCGGGIPVDDHRSMSVRVRVS
jgi:hypothetical protein